jgi:hypothetical protein
MSITVGSQSGAAAAIASTAARTLSPASSSRFTSRTAPITWVESVRALPPAPTRPWVFSASSSRSSTRCSKPCATTRVRNSQSTEGSNPSSSRSSPSAYFQEILSRTASAAWRSVRFSTICNTETSANRPGDHPGRPRTPNPGANSASGTNSPNRSRTTTGSGGCRRR